MLNLLGYVDATYKQVFFVQTFRLHPVIQSLFEFQTGLVSLAPGLSALVG